MATPILEFMPVRDSYTVTPAYNTIEVRLDGGKSRKRTDVFGGVHIITPTWILDKTDYTAFMGFFRERIQQGSRSFIAPILTDIAFVMDHLCTLVGGMPKLVQQAGDAYYVTATLEVTPNPCKTFSVRFQNVGLGPTQGRVLDMGSADYTGEISEFPVGRNVRIVGSRQTDPGWGGVFIDVDGVYQIDSITAVHTFDLLNPASVNSAWTTLGSLTPTHTATGIGACILVPV